MPTLQTTFYNTAAVGYGYLKLYYTFTPNYSATKYKFTVDGFELHTDNVSSCNAQVDVLLGSVKWSYSVTMGYNSKSTIHYGDKTTSSRTLTLKLKQFGVPANIGTGNASEASTSLTVPAIVTYTISYNANGGSGAPSSQTKYQGSSITLSSTRPTRTNYVFKNWNTSSSGSGTSYSPGGTYSKDSNATLYAQWYAPYQVSYNANGGSGAPSSQYKIYGTNLTLSSTKPTRTGYIFKCWNSNSSGTGTNYNPSQSYTSNANLTLYAIWNPIISYDANGGSGAPSVQNKTFGTNITLSSTTPTRSGYTFVNWNTVKGGTGTAYNPGATYSSNDSVTLYAQWLKGHDAPTISSITVVRSDSSGTASDEGTYCKVTAKWSIDTKTDSTNTATVRGTITPDGGSSTSFTIDSGGSGTSGTATALVSGCSTDVQYSISIIVTDKYATSTRTGIMTRANYILDLKQGGRALGIGSAAPDNDGLEIGWVAQFDKNVTMLMALSVTGNLTVSGTFTAEEFKITTVTSDVVSSTSSGWSLSSQSAKKYGKIVSIYLVLYSTSELSAGGARTICNLNSSYRPAIYQGFCDSNGIGTISNGGGVYYRNLVNITTSTVIRVVATYIVS